jgi:hypothetical protein
MFKYKNVALVAHANENSIALDYNLINDDTVIKKDTLNKLDKLY